MRFNEKELKTLALQNSQKFEKEGNLKLTEKQEGFFRKTEGDLIDFSSFIKTCYIFLNFVVGTFLLIRQTQLFLWNCFNALKEQTADNNNSYFYHFLINQKLQK